MNNKKLILIVDEEPDVTDALSVKLEQEGFDTIAAYNGEQGLMKDEWGRKVPVIFLTNLDDEETVSKVMKDKGYEYLVKTEWKIEDIVAKIKKKLEEK